MKVIAVMQAEGQEPVQMTWASDTDEVGAILSVAQLFQHAKDQSPWQPNVLSIVIDL